MICLDSEYETDHVALARDAVGLKYAIRCRISRNSLRGMATAAIWNVA
jgi:hypothetical protein